MIRFDTRDKKPNLYSILFLTIIAAAVVALLARNDPGKHALAISIVLDVFFLAVILLLITAFFRQIQYNPYSYNTIYYTGFALIALTVWITYLVLTVRLIRTPENYRIEYAAFILLDSAKNFMLLSAPFILVFSIGLCVSNISLIQHEGKRLVNILGILLSVLMVAGEVFLFRFDYYASGSLRQIRIHEFIGNLFAAVYLYYECMLIGAILADAIAARYEPEPDKDFLIILGCGLRKDGTPSPLLRGRIDRALAFYESQKARTGKEPLFVTSGGQGPDEVNSESAAMKRYLLEKGIPAERILEEDRSGNTFENMKYSKEIIEKHKPDGKIAFSTTNYHVFRSGLYARRVKMRAVGMGAPTKWYFWPNAAVREFVGLLTEHRGKQALIFGGLILFYTVLVPLVYR